MATSSDTASNPFSEFYSLKNGVLRLTVDMINAPDTDPQCLAAIANLKTIKAHTLDFDRLSIPSHYYLPKSKIFYHLRFNTLINAIAENTNITNWVLYGIRFDLFPDYITNAVISGISIARSLHTLVLERSLLTTERHNLVQLANAIKSTQIVVLDISHNNLGHISKGCLKAFLNPLIGHPTLRSLKIAHNFLAAWTDKIRPTLLLNLIERTSLTAIDLSYNEYTEVYEYQTDPFQVVNYEPEPPQVVEHGSEPYEMVTHEPKFPEKVEYAWQPSVQTHFLTILQTHPTLSSVNLVQAAFLGKDDLYVDRLANALSNNPRLENVQLSDVHLVDPHYYHTVIYNQYDQKYGWSDVVLNRFFETLNRHPFLTVDFVENPDPRTPYFCSPFSRTMVDVFNARTTDYHNIRHAASLQPLPGRVITLIQEYDPSVLSIDDACKEKLNAEVNTRWWKEQKRLQWHANIRYYPYKKAVFSSQYKSVYEEFLLSSRKDRPDSTAAPSPTLCFSSPAATITSTNTASRPKAQPTSDAMGVSQSSSSSPSQSSSSNPPLSLHKIKGNRP